jgi:diguanylate cyclase (GGDEF)-like protein
MSDSARYRGQDLSKLASDSRTNHCIRFLDRFIEDRGGLIGLLLGQLDVFNRISSTFGHDAADAFYTDYIEQLRRGLPAAAHVIRLPGRRFAVALSLTSMGQVMDLANTIAEDLQPTLGDRFMVDVTLGIAAHPTHAENGANLLRRAELALKEAHEQALSFELYKPDTTHQVAALWKLEGELENAINQRELGVQYQPKVALSDGSVIGLEALVRWRTAGGLVRPASFIPLAERKGTIIPLTWLVLDRVAETVNTWVRLAEPISIAVNVTPQVLVHNDFYGRIHDLQVVLQAANVGLAIEITEDSLLKADPSTTKVMERLRQDDIGISLDDFGKGYSSLTYLKQIPASELKVDRQFITALHTDRADQQIVKSVVDLAHALNMQVIAEGVESAENWDIVRQLGCDAAQGFFISRPLPSSRVMSWLNTSAQDLPWIRMTAAAV